MGVSASASPGEEMKKKTIFTKTVMGTEMASYKAGRAFSLVIPFVATVQ